MDLEGFTTYTAKKATLCAANKFDRKDEARLRTRARWDANEGLATFPGIVLEPPRMRSEAGATMIKVLVEILPSWAPPARY